MFFLLRAFLCIAVIVALADGFAPARLWEDSRQSVSKVAASTTAKVSDYCEHNLSRCLAVVEAAGADKPPVPVHRKMQEQRPKP